jgi:hypothetical protein
MGPNGRSGRFAKNHEMPFIAEFNRHPEFNATGPLLPQISLPISTRGKNYFSQ